MNSSASNVTNFNERLRWLQHVDRKQQDAYAAQIQSFQYYGGYWTEGFSGGDWIQGTPPGPPALPAPVASEISREHRGDLAPRKNDGLSKAQYDQTEPAPVDPPSKAALGVYHVQLATSKLYGLVPWLICPLRCLLPPPRTLAVLASHFIRACHVHRGYCSPENQWVTGEPKKLEVDASSDAAPDIPPAADVAGAEDAEAPDSPSQKRAREDAVGDLPTKARRSE